MSETQNFAVRLKQHRKLLLAVLPSLFLHLLLVTALSVDLPQTDNDVDMIEARLVNLEPAKAITSAVPQAEINQAKKSVPTPVHRTASKPKVAEPEMQPSNIANTETSNLGTLSSATLNMRAMENMDANQQQKTDEGNAQSLAEMELEKVIYTQVEAEFEVRRGNDSAPAGITKISFNLDKNKRYTLLSQTEAKGLASLFFSNLLQKSEGSVTDSGLRPDFYSYQYGGISAKKLQTANFDWEKSILTLRNAKGESSMKLTDGTQDFLSFMYQFMYMPPLNNLQITMTNGKKLRTYDYAFEGEEIITSKFGELKTIHLLKSSVDDEKTELWLATDYQYLPVKIRKTEKDGTVIEQLISKLSTSQSPQSP